MNNKEFIAELARINNMKSTDAQRMVNTVLSAMCDNFQEGNTVQMTGFGMFEVKKKQERVIRNPSTGQRMLVPPKLTLSFKPNTQTKENIRKGDSDNG